MALLSRDQIRAAVTAGLPRKTLHVPALGGDVTVRGMSGKELTLFQDSLWTGKGKKRKVVTVNIQAKMAVRCVLNEDGTRMFTDEDVDWLGDLRGDALVKIFDAIQTLSGMSTDDDEDDEDDASGK